MADGNGNGGNGGTGGNGGNGGTGNGVPKGGLPLMVRCPLCRKPTPYQGNPFRPFCSERCQVNDQANWAEEKYTLPTQDGPSEEGEE